MKNHETIPVTLTNLLIVLSCFLLASCHFGNERAYETKDANTPCPVNLNRTAEKDSASNNADAARILSRQQVPVLCYHQIREWRTTDSKVAKDYIVPVATFRQQIKMLADSGYRSILPDQLMAYLQNGEKLPPKSVMLTFDDTDLSQYTIAMEELNKAHFKGVFFIMTVALNRPGYMSREQVTLLAQQGHVIGSHTWDHHNVKKYKEADWVTQVEKPAKQLENITGAPVKYFAYPFGLWDTTAIYELKKRGFSAAFQLSTKRDEKDPLFTIRRIIIPGQWNTLQFSNAIKNSFRPATSG